MNRLYSAFALVAFLGTALSPISASAQMSSSNSMNHHMMVHHMKHHRKHRHHRHHVMMQNYQK